MSTGTVAIPTIVCLVKAFRVIALSGKLEYREDGITVPEAGGVIELTGARTNGMLPTLWIGFTDALVKSPFSFKVTELGAVGTLILPRASFAAYLALANTPHAYFRLGGNGALNALASERSVLED